MRAEIFECAFDCSLRLSNLMKQEPAEIKWRSNEADELWSKACIVPDIFSVAQLSNLQVYLLTENSPFNLLGMNVIKS
jgi:hypothetical protein